MIEIHIMSLISLVVSTFSLGVSIGVYITSGSRYK